MRYAMVVNIFLMVFMVGNIMDIFEHETDWSPSGPSIALSAIAIILIYVYMLRTPERNVISLRKVKHLIDKEEYEKLVKRKNIT